MMEATKGIYHKYRKGATKDCFLLNIWFSSIKASKAMNEVGDKFIGIVKKITKGSSRTPFEMLTKDWPGGSYLLLWSKPMVPGYSPLIDVGYKYNAQKSLSSIVTDNAGIT